MSINPPQRLPRSLRPREEAPFCWFARAALDWIERSPQITNQARAKLVYVAGHVAEASHQGKPVYRAPKALIARLAGVSVRTVTAANAELAAAGLILIKRNYDAERKEHEISTYTLCSFRRPGSGNSSITPPAENRLDVSPPIIGNATLPQSGISPKEKEALPKPGVPPAPAVAGPVDRPADATPPRPVLNTW
jgi:hypothetical protein